MKKLAILFISVLAFAATGCCGLHGGGGGGGCNSCGYGGAGQVGYATPTGTTSAALVPTAAPTLAATPPAYGRTASVAPIEALPTF